MPYFLISKLTTSQEDLKTAWVLWFFLLFFILFKSDLPPPPLFTVSAVRHWQMSWRIKFKKSTLGQDRELFFISIPTQAKPKHMAEICLLVSHVCSNEWSRSLCSLLSIIHRCECESVILTMSKSGLFQHSCRLFPALPWESPAFSFRITHSVWCLYIGYFTMVQTWLNQFIFIMYCCFEFLKCCIMFLLH